MRIAIAGSGRLGTGLLRALRDSRHQVVAVLQNGRTARGVLRKTLAGLSCQLPVLARQTGLPIFWIDRMDEAELAPLRALAPDLLLVGGFSIILKKPLLELPRIGCVNVHSSLLPKHRGPNPFTAVLLGGDKETGVTFHVMDTDIDTGGILDQTAFPLTRDDTLVTVHHRACRIAAERVTHVIDGIEAKGLDGTPQDPALATYDKKISHEATRIRWEKPAVEIDRLVRALGLPQPAHFKHRGGEVHVFSVYYDETPADAAPGTVLAMRPRVVVATGAGSVSLRAAATAKFGWRWPLPMPMHRPAVGEVFEAPHA